MSTRFTETVERLGKLHPWDVPVNPDVQNHIITLYNTVHGQGGEAFCEREARFIHRTIIDDKAKWNVTSLSVFLAFVDLAVKDLTLEPGAQAVCYLLSRNTELTAPDGKKYWENRCYISVTGYGEILMRQRCGQIRHCDTPTVVYEGDQFSYVESDGRKHVTYGLNIAHNPANPIACFMKITRIDGSIDYAIILPEGWARLSKFSERQNKGKANALYTSGAGQTIDPGFLIAKCVKHAFKSYPKLPIGRGMVMEADLPEEEQMPDYYSLDNAAPETVGSRPAATADTSADTQPESGDGKQSFAEPADISRGVVVESSDDDDIW